MQDIEKFTPTKARVKKVCDIYGLSNLMLDTSNGSQIKPYKVERPRLST
jgi:hypothetical protein